MKSFDFDDILHDLSSNSEFDEIPVDIETFITDPKYLTVKPASDMQLRCLKVMTQIYKKETLINLYGLEEGLKRWKHNYNEIDLLLGKSSGKNWMSAIACVYVVYLLLCLKDPAGYFNRDKGDAIDIVNIAVNAKQANDVFFTGFCNKIQESPWFLGKYDKQAAVVKFDKGIRVHSGNSEKEGLEGYNVIVAVLDEISGFNMQSTTGNVKAKTADDVFRMFKGSVDSRFPTTGKTILLSFPRYKDDYLSTRYRSAIAQKETIIRSYTFKIDEDAPDGIEENEFKIEWEEDKIISYKENFPSYFSLKRPTWELNPTMPIENLKNAFLTDAKDALARFAVMPPDTDTDAYFPSRAKLETAFCNPRLMVNEYGDIDPNFRPDPNKKYYMHVDLSQTHDRTAVAMSHVDSYKSMKIAGDNYLTNPKIIVDFVRYWTPSKQNPIDMMEVKSFILEIYNMGFDIGLITFDRWHSVDMMMELAAHGMKTENLSLNKKHYDDMKLAIAEERIEGPQIEILIDELAKLKIIKNKVDHTRCLVGETRIPLLDGTCPKISELDGSEVLVYSSNKFGEIVPAKAWVFCSGKTKSLVDVVLDNGFTVRCTPDHRFLLKNGEYKEAQHLVPAVDMLKRINFAWLRSSWDEIRKSKIKSVVKVNLPEGVPVYDLSVPEFNNFALISGIFVHNSGHNDLSEAICGSIFNTTSYSPRYDDIEIDIVTLGDLKNIERQERIKQYQGQNRRIPMDVPKQMPDDISEYLKNMKVI